MILSKPCINESLMHWVCPFSLRAHSLVHLTGLYQCTNQLLVQYVPSCAKPYQVYQHMIHRGIPMYRPYQSAIGLLCTTHTKQYTMVWRTLAYSNIGKAFDNYNWFTMFIDGNMSLFTELLVISLIWYEHLE